jgi:hypothetical protein
MEIHCRAGNRQDLTPCVLRFVDKFHEPLLPWPRVEAAGVDQQRMTEVLGCGLERRGA